MTPLFREMERVSEKFTTAIRGITVEKSVWANGEGLSVVRFEISSDRDDAVRLRMVESVPSDFPMENLGPHPKYGGDKWTKTDDGAFVYTDRLAPEGEAFTLYGIKGLSQSSLESFLTEVGVEIDPAGDEPTTDSDDLLTMTNDNAENSEPDDETTAQETTFKPGDDFEGRIPRVEDLRSTSGSWSTSRTGRDRDISSDIQFVGSKSQNAAERDDGPSANDGSLELADPTEGDADSSVEASTSDSAEPVVETDTLSPDNSDSTAVDEESEELTDAAEEADHGSDEPDGESVDVETPDIDEDGEVDSAEVVEDDVDTAESEAEDADAPTSEVSATDESEPAEHDASEVESIVDALVEELSSRDLSDDELAVLRDSLGTSAPTSLDARLSHVQNRVDNLAAYTKALEEFLDENGTAEQVIDGLQTETAEMRDDIEQLESALTASKDAIQTIEAQVESIEDSLVTEAVFEERLTELDQRLVSEWKLDAQVDKLTSEISEIRDDVETGKVWRSNLSQAIQLPGMMDDRTEADDAGGHSDTEESASSTASKEGEDAENTEAAEL
ncbi:MULTISPECIES: hypothetical protein [Haloferax]|uniref:Uncharacterized protein n=2 Tax=Haloferax TaxID=2251 RepID=A0A6G1Z6C5_9EURY|nr:MULTISPECIES: hypothetical protein [Haloferax]KAB1185012.1 hypothetical protein Hfx1149_15935 [Haloferax sp. CBA1149]MRW82187.1 hypothetical protein [Haloferax marinisediminis]